jgi:diguanylate cyclase (GGDEF)-like protein
MTIKKGEVIVNKELNIVSADDAYKEYVCEDGAGTIFANVHPDDQHLLYEMVEGLTFEAKVTLCYRMCEKSGEYNWVSSTCQALPDDNISITIQDLVSMERGVKASEIDYLTGLFNKKAITDFAKKACESGDSHIVNLCIVDIDNFKHVNDAYGHAYGDRILREVADIILEVLGDDGRAGRIGGDELMMIIENVEEKTDLRVYLKSIRERVEASHRDENGIPQITVSMGIGTYPLYVDNYEDLFNLADRMLYRAKNRGKNRYVIYNPEIHGRIVNGELDESTTTINSTTAVDKTKLVLDAMENMFVTFREAIPTLLMKIAATYDLDETYIFYKGIETSIHGFKRVSDSGNATNTNVLRMAGSVSSLEYVVDSEVQALFNSNGVLVIDTPQTTLVRAPEAGSFFAEHDIRHAFLYKMQNSPCEGYIAMYNTRELTRKFPQPDITDLTYLSKLIEIALKTR